MFDTKEIILIFEGELKNEKDEKKLFELKNIFFKKHINPLISKIRDVPNDQKKEYGILTNQLKNKIEEKFTEILNQSIPEDSRTSKVPPMINSTGIKCGGINLIDKTIREINHFFSKLGFDILEGDEVTEGKYNFDALNIDENHPARAEHDSFYVDDNQLLRSHCTAATAKFMENSKSEEIKIISSGNVYRKDDDDATHSHQFNQVDLVWIGKYLSIKNLKWLVNSFLSEIFNIKNLETRYRLSYFPFTEPSFEVDIKCFNCDAQGCNICKSSGWIEILGAGIFHPNVISVAKLDKSMIGLAAGIGIDRIVMIKYGINDIRHLYNNDFKLLKQFKGNI